jgi:hypothetical protein
MPFSVHGKKSRVPGRPGMTTSSAIFLAFLRAGMTKNGLTSYLASVCSLARESVL